MRVIIYRIIPKDALSSYLHESTRISTKERVEGNRRTRGSWDREGKWTKVAKVS